ncbi:hypothetical protein Tco_0577522 [Tanacetum coccineum]
MANNETYTCSPSEVCLSDSDSELLIPTSWSDESKNEKRQKDKGTDVMKDKVSQENVCEEEVPLNNNIGKQICDFVDMPSEAVEQGMDANVPDEIDGAKDEQVPNHVVKKGNLEFLVCKKIANPGVNELVDKVRPLKRKRVYADRWVMHLPKTNVNANNGLFMCYLLLLMFCILNYPCMYLL